MLSHVAGPSNFLGQTEAKARCSLVQSLARIWLQQNRIHRSYLEELLPAADRTLTSQNSYYYDEADIAIQR